MTRRRLTKSEFEAVQKSRPNHRRLQQAANAALRDTTDRINAVLNAFPEVTRDEAIRTVDKPVVAISEDRWRFDEAPTNMAIASSMGLVIVADVREQMGRPMTDADKAAYFKASLEELHHQENIAPTEETR